MGKYKWIKIRALIKYPDTYYSNTRVSRYEFSSFLIGQTQKLSIPKNKLEPKSKFISVNY